MSKSKKNEKKFNLEEFISKSKTDKKKYILEEAKKITPPDTIHTNLYDAYKNKEIINKFIKDYINLKNDTEDQIKENITSKINKFKKNYIEIKLPEKIATKKNSVFSMVGAEIFKSAQTISKSLSTSMGSLWEKIASCSNNVINTEEEFGIKITGVDAIALIDGKLRTQSKICDGAFHT